MPRRARSIRNHTGFTLLEVVLALAILAGSIAVLGEIMRSAGRSASDAQAETTAQLHAASIMDKVLAGLLEAVDQDQVPLETEDSSNWTYSLTIGQTTVDELISVEILVQQDLEPQFNPVRYRLVRWVALQQESEDSINESEESTEDSDGS